MNLLVKSWPEPLQRQLKSEAIRQGRTVREVMVEAAEQWLRRNADGGGKGSRRSSARRGRRNASGR